MGAAAALRVKAGPCAATAASGPAAAAAGARQALGPAGRWRLPAAAAAAAAAAAGGELMARAAAVPAAAGAGAGAAADLHGRQRVVWVSLLPAGCLTLRQLPPAAAAAEPVPRHSPGTGILPRWPGSATVGSWSAQEQGAKARLRESSKFCTLLARGVQMVFSCARMLFTTRHQAAAVHSSASSWAWHPLQAAAVRTCALAPCSSMEYRSYA